MHNTVANGQQRQVFPTPTPNLADTNTNHNNDASHLRAHGVSPAQGAAAGGLSTFGTASDGNAAFGSAAHQALALADFLNGGSGPSIGDQGAQQFLSARAQEQPQQTLQETLQAQSREQLARLQQKQQRQARDADRYRMPYQGQTPSIMEDNVLMQSQSTAIDGGGSGQDTAFFGSSRGNDIGTTGVGANTFASSQQSYLQQSFGTSVAAGGAAAGGVGVGVGGRLASVQEVEEMIMFRLLA